MRLICPNCGAQYEVPDAVIPPAGRDVQCSNCGITWFQRAAGQDPELAEELGEVPMTRGWSDPDPEPAPPPPPAPEIRAAEPPPPPPQPARRTLDPAVADLLREEAARETRVRAAEAARAGTLETQTELGLAPPVEDEAARRNREARERLARLRGPEVGADTPPASDIPPRRGVRPAGRASVPEDVPDPAQVANGSATRRELLPDIEEINSTLRVGTERRPAEAGDHDTPGTPAPRSTTPSDGTEGQSGFARGFMIPVVLAVGLGALYAQGPRLAAQFPDLAAPITQYVATVDDARGWLDGKAQGLLVWLDGMAETATTP